MTTNDQGTPTGYQFPRAIWITAALTVLMLGLIASPIWWPNGGFSSPLFGLLGFNGLSLIAYPLIYFGGLTLYVRQLRSLLGRILEQDRRLPLDAAWLVIAVPFNFVGSFFVVAGTAQSLIIDGRITSASVQRWRWLGFAWCSFQVLAFFPNMAVSFTALLISYVLWAAHWAYSVTLDEELASPKEADGE